MRGSYVSHLNATHLNAALPQHSGQLWLTVVRICGCRDFNQAIRFRPGEAEHQRKLLIKKATNAVEPLGIKREQLERLADETIKGPNKFAE